MRTLAFTLVLLAGTLLSLGCTGGDGGGGDDAPARTFWSWDLSVMPPQDKEVDAHQRAITDNFYVYVEDALWNDDVVTQAMLDDLVTTLEDATPAGSIDPAAGIVDNDVATFGPIPDAIDGDPRVYLLLMNIEGFQSFEFDGFFRALDQEPDGSDPDYRSNEIEMLFVNGEIRDVNSETTKSVIAHELVHLLEWGLDPAEDGWLSETFGELGMTINGFYTDESWVDDLAAHPEESLFGSEFSVHYGACLLFGNYLYERFGASFISDLAAIGSNGTVSIDAALSTAAPGETFETVFLDWVAANALDASGDYGYEFADIPEFVSVATITTTNAAATFVPLTDPKGARYVRVQVPGPISLAVTHGASTPAGARVLVMRYSSADPQNVFDVAVHAGTEASVAFDLDATYDEAILGLVAFDSAQTFSVQVVPN